MARIHETVRDALDHMAKLWELEGRTLRARFVSSRQERTLAQRVERGAAVDNLCVLELVAAPGRRTLAWVTRADGLPALSVADLSMKPGTPVVLWLKDPDDPEDATPGVVARTRVDQLGVMVEGEWPEHLDAPGFRIDMEDPQVTFARGRAAMERALGADDPRTVRLLDVLLGARHSEDALSAYDAQLSFFDTALHDDQRHAVRRALARDPVALVHGPPGTGKTRTVVEIIRQLTARGERVLAAAASNLATDHLAEVLLSAGVQVVRIGHPARVTDDVAAWALDALVEEQPIYSLAKGWMEEAGAIRRTIQRRAQRGSMSRQERREAYREARRLVRDAREQIAKAEQMILGRADVVLCTASSATTRILADMEFDVVVLDEATQAVDPVALIAILRAPKLVMAGDPCQLAPTVLDPEADRAGLGRTFFERLAERDESSVALLTVQHRMHRDIMAYPSASMYDGRLAAAAHVADHTLEDLGVVPDPLRPGALVFVDSAGKGWDEVSSEDDPSRSNPGEAERVAAEARRLLGRGLKPGDLAIIAPYDAQVRVLRQLMAEEIAAGVDVATVDGFQGREKEAVIVGLVRSNGAGEIGFLADVRRMNVALTRARRLMMVVGDSATVGQHPFYAGLLEVVQGGGGWVSAWSDEAEPFEHGAS
ncbi:MAG: AAA domain-containing protein [Myxococcota bacterium]